MSRKSSYHHGDLRSALLTAATEILRERGVAGLSLRECARRAGVSHTAPYRHFASKDALLAALVGQGFRWLVAAADPSDAGDPSERLDAYGVAYVRFAIDHPEHHRLMFATKLDPAAFSPDDQAACDAAFDHLVALASARSETGADPEVAAAAFWSLVHGLSMLILDGRIPPERVATPAAVEALTRACFAHWRASGA